MEGTRRLFSRRNLLARANTEICINIERSAFADYGDDELTVKVTSKQEEATKYLETSFVWVGVKDSLIFLRKRK